MKKISNVLYNKHKNTINTLENKIKKTICTNNMKKVPININDIEKNIKREYDLSKWRR